MLLKLPWHWISWLTPCSAPRAVSTFATPSEAQTLRDLVRTMHLPDAASQAMRNRLLEQHSESQAALSLATARSVGPVGDSEQLSSSSPSYIGSQENSSRLTPRNSMLRIGSTSSELRLPIPELDETAVAGGEQHS